MKLDLEEGCGSCRMSPLPLKEEVMPIHGRIGDARVLGTVGTTKFMRIIEEDCNSSSSSSIGKDSDDEGEESQGEAQSACRNDHHNNNSRKISNGSLDDAILALEEALPIRRGISRFYNGKSKSFACLAQVWVSSTPSIKEIAKPENAYSRKRRNLVASLVRNKFQLPRVSSGQISKKPKTLRLGFGEEDDLTKPQKQNLTSMRSLSMVNLHGCSLNTTKIENY